MKNTALRKTVFALCALFVVISTASAHDVVKHRTSGDLWGSGMEETVQGEGESSERDTGNFDNTELNQFALPDKENNLWESNIQGENRDHEDSANWNANNFDNTEELNQFALPDTNDGTWGTAEWITEETTEWDNADNLDEEMTAYKEQEIGRESRADVASEEYAKVAWSLLYHSQKKTDWQRAKRLFDKGARKLVAYEKEIIKDRSEEKQAGIRQIMEGKKDKIRQTIRYVQSRYDRKRKKSEETKKSAEIFAATKGWATALVGGYVGGNNSSSYLSSAQTELENYTADMSNISDDYRSELDAANQELEQTESFYNARLSKVSRSESVQLSKLSRWESVALSKVNVDVKSHGVRFIVPPKCA